MFALHCSTGGGKRRSCRLCTLYTSCYDGAGLAEELAQFTRQVTSDGVAILEFSGGRDSTIALSMLRKRLGIDVIAVTLCDGFIPDPVIDQAKRICRKLHSRYVLVAGVFDWRVVRDRAERPRMADVGLMFNRQLNSTVVSIAQKTGIQWSVNGENKYRAIAPRVSALGQLRTPDGFSLNTINLPFAMGIAPCQGDAILAGLNWRDLGVPGLSSNSLLPWLSAESQYLEGHGNALFELVAAEVRCGHLTRDEGFVAIHNAECATQEEVNTKLEEAIAWSSTRRTPEVLYDSAGDE